MTSEQTGRGAGGRQNPNRPSQKGEGRSPDERRDEGQRAPGEPGEQSSLDIDPDRR
jgi:hypothetical protein